MGNPCKSVFLNTHEWEQQERNKTETDEDGNRGVSMERSKAGTNKRSPDGLPGCKNKKNCNIL